MRISDWSSDVCSSDLRGRWGSTLMSQGKSSIRANLADRARGVGSLRDFLELLEEYGQAITWTDRIMPQPDLRNIAVAASRDVTPAPAILFDNIEGHPGKRTAVGVQGSWDDRKSVV